MSLAGKSAINAFVNEVAIEIDEKYQFDNTPSGNRDEKIFIGRATLIDKFLRFLHNSNAGIKKRGVYLVTGYRGMGKTSFVNAVVSKYCEEVEQKRKSGLASRRIPKIEKIEINLAQKQPQEIDILKSMVSRVYYHYHLFFKKRIIINPLFLPRIKRAFGYSAFLFFILLLATVLYSKSIESLLVKQDQSQQKIIHSTTRTTIGGTVIVNDTTTSPVAGKPLPSSNLIGKLTLIETIQLFLGLLFLLAVIGRLRLFIRCVSSDLYKSWDRIETLYKRCYTPYSVERNRQNEFSFSQMITRIGTAEKETVSFPLASSKEIEFELSQFLTECSRVNFIFVFDELDKIESAAVSTSYAEDATTGEENDSQTAYLQQLRDRKQAIINIIASLKNMLTTTNARFIFIAGREMFDASLADVADRQSALGSIFSYVFYIDSFLKESDEGISNRAALGGMIEKLLKGVIFGQAAINGQSAIKSVGDNGKGDVQPTLYDLVIEQWLSSRSQKSGSVEWQDELPLWKMIMMLQSFIVYVTYRSNGSPKKIIKTIQEFIWVEGEEKLLGNTYKNVFLFPNKKNDRTKKKAYLLFDFPGQYRIQYINHLYLPFLVKHGHNYKKYSDNILISTSYLFDHLLKFHPFAFSVSNLELIPEVLSTSKTPSLREYILTIVDYLSNSHIRETEVGLFDYKFYSRTQNELSYISKEFEEESAAFNFTLDEAYLVKLHIRNELRETRQVYDKISAAGGLVYPKTHLYGILGDLHFFDQEYDDAIVAYSGAIHGIKDNGCTSLVEFVTLINFKLKLGLCFEKRKSYEEALSFYTEACEQASSFINCRFAAQIASNQQSVLSDLLQIVNQPFLATMVLQEKMGIEGITQHKFSLAIGGFLKLARAIQDICGRNHLIFANFYLILGNLLYFKNSPRGFEDSDIAQKFSAEEYKKLEDLIGQYRNLNADNKRKPVLALYFYCIGVIEVLKSKESKEEQEKDMVWSGGSPVRDILNKIVSNKLLKENQYTKNYYKYTATFLSNIGDCILGAFEMKDLPALPERLEKKKYYTHDVTVLFVRGQLLKTPGPDDRDKGEDHFIELLKPTESDIQLADVLKCYYWSAYLYKRRGRLVSYSYQLRKILYVLRLVLEEKTVKINREINRNFIFYLEKLIVEPILTVVSQTNEQADMYTMNKYDKIFRQYKKKVDVAGWDEQYFSGLQKYLRGNSCSHPDIQETKALFYYIILKLKCTDPKWDFSRFLSPYGSFATQYTRVFELEFWCKYHSQIPGRSSDRVSGEGVGNWVIVKDAATTAAEDCNPIHEFLYCMFSKLLIFEIYGMDYMIGHSFPAYTHYQLALFLKDHMYPIDKRQFPEQLNSIIETLGYNITDAVYNAQRAKYHYEKAIQLHTGGQEYRSAINDMVYLEDDINDNAYHFGAALDRYMLANLVFDTKIRECEQLIREMKAQ